MSASPETMNAIRGYEFGPFFLDISRNLLYRGSAAMPLAPRVINLLVVLVQNRGKDLEKNYLMDQLWPSVAVEENNLTVTMSALRKVLGESPGQHMYVVTLPGRGYRFVAKVREVGYLESPELVPPLTFARPQNSVGPADASAGADEETPKVVGLIPESFLRPSKALLTGRTKFVSVGVVFFIIAAIFFVRIILKATTTAAAAPQTIAVLPFKSAGPQSDSGYLGLGMADALVSRLGALRGVAVRPTRSVLQYSELAYEPKKAGQDLHVGAVVDGTVERAGELVRLSVRLVRVSDGSVLWSNEFSGKFAEIFAFQDDIASQVSRALTLNLNGDERRHLRKHYTKDTEAYQLYLRGRYFWNRRTPDSIAKAINFFQQAVAKDPSFALAYSGLADCYNLSAYYSDELSSEAFSKAEAAAQKALSLDDSLAEAYNSLALARMDYKWDFPGAEVAYRRALQLDPEYATAHQWYAEYLIAMGREQEARSEARRAQDLDSMSLINNATVGEIEFYSRNYDQAVAQLRATLDLDQRFWPAAWFLGWTYEAQGNTQEALQLLEKAHGIFPKDAQITSELAYAYADSGDKSRAQQCLHELEKMPRKLGAYPYTIALVYAAMGDKDTAFKWLASALQGRCWMLVYAKADPRMDRLRSDPRFNDVIKKVGLVS